MGEEIYYNQFTKKKGNIYDLSGEFGIGYTCNTNEPFYFDKEDYEKIKEITWRARHDSRKGRDNSYYIESIVNKTINGKKKKYRIHLHHFVFGIVDNFEKSNIIVDHINQNKADCRKENLRIADLRINNINKNKQSTNTTGFIGVEFNKKRNLWIARICVSKNNRVAIYQGKSRMMAIKARLNAELYYYKEDAPQKNLFEKYKITEETAQSFIEKRNKKLMANNTSGVVGVSFCKKYNLWEAYITKERKQIIICRTKEKTEAIIARLKAEKIYYDELKWQKHLWKEYGIEDE